MLEAMIDLRLAPMAAVTNTPFRLDLPRVRGRPAHQRGARRPGAPAGQRPHREMTRFLPEERPIAMQLLGSDPDVLAEAARRLEAAGADAIDLNMGCPVAKIVSKGQGAALMRDPLGAAVILRTMRKAISVRFTVKIRGGWDERSVNAVEIARVAEGEGVDAITVHPRTRSQQYAGVAPWEIIGSVSLLSPSRSSATATSGAAPTRRRWSRRPAAPPSWSGAERSGRRGSSRAGRNA
jgi:tRNA-dihydrouridine synthase B